MDVVFLDANVLFSAAWMPGSGLHRLWKLPEVRLISSAYAVEEARRNLPEQRMRDVLERLLIDVTVFPSLNEEPAIPESVTLVAKDRPILAAAIRCGATHLITGDKTHFGALFGTMISGVRVMPPDRYLRDHL